jgi:signal transduction histidine kinase
MTLRGRFALWFSLAALVPIAAAAFVTHEFLSRESRESFEKRRGAAIASMEAELDRMRQRVGEVVQSVASLEDELVGGVVTNLEKYEGELPARLVRDLQRRGPVKMNGFGLDLLIITDAADRVLVAPHNSAIVAETHEIYSQRARALPGRAVFVTEELIAASESGDGGAARTLRERLVVEAADMVRDRSQRVTVVAGALVSDDLLARVRDQPDIDARVVSASRDGGVLVDSLKPWKAPASETSRIALLGPDGSPAAHVELYLSDAELQRILRQATLYPVLIGAAALIACALLGLIVGRRMTRDLDQLIIGVHAAARGDLDHQVPVRTGDEIGELSIAVNSMMIDLRESKERLANSERVAAWQEIARRLAHEIKNPLTPIQMSVETLRKTWTKKHPSFDEIFEESTGTILEEAGRLKRIVGEFSEFARMPKPDKQPLDLNDLVTSTTALYKGTVELELSLGEIPKIEADRDTLSQVLLNLLENARDAIGTRGGLIRVTTLATRTGRAVALLVDDNGPGIPAAVKEKLFTPYFTTKHATGGSGLGLAIVHRIISDHDGKILVTGSPLGGARFVVELPTSEATADDLSASLTGQLPKMASR